MRTQHALLAATLLVLPSNVPDDASPGGRPAADQSVVDQATDHVAAGVASTPPPGEPGTARSAPGLPSSSDLETMRWVAGRFSLVGLQVPDVEIVFHPSSEECGWHDGRYRSDGTTRRIDVCVPDHGTFASDLSRRRTLVHELAHAWDDVNFDDDDRSALLPVLGAEEWYGPEDDWAARGIERFAEAIVWGLYDQRRRPTKVDVPCSDLHRVFVEVTGHEPLGPIEPICEPTRGAEGVLVAAVGGCWEIAHWCAGRTDLRARATLDGRAGQCLTARAAPSPGLTRCAGRRWLG